MPPLGHGQAVPARQPGRAARAQPRHGATAHPLQVGVRNLLVLVMSHGLQNPSFPSHPPRHASLENHRCPGYWEVPLQTGDCHRSVHQQS